MQVIRILSAAATRYYLKILSILNKRHVSLVYQAMILGTFQEVVHLQEVFPKNREEKRSKNIGKRNAEGKVRNLLDMNAERI